MTASMIVLLGVGPNAAEPPRVRDLLDAIAFHEPACTHVVAINDPAAGTTRDLAAEVGWTGPGPELVVIQHPGHSPKEGWSSGLNIGLVEGLRWIAANADPDLVIKLDTDTLIVGPCAQRIAGRFAQDDRLGLLGVARVNVDGGKRRPALWGRRVRSMRWPIWVRPRSMVNDNWTGIVRPAIGANQRYVRSVINAALASPDYVEGDHCQGGGYAMSRRYVHALRDAGDLDRALAWHHTFLTEDVMFGMLCGARGLTMDDFCREGEVFGVTWKGLPGTPEDLLKDGFSVVHSLRNDENHSEDELRAKFRELTGRPSPNAPTAAAV